MMTQICMRALLPAQASITSTPYAHDVRAFAARFISSPWLHALFVVALALALFVPGLGASGYAHAEAFRVQPAHEMMERGDFVVVRLFEQAYLRKPPGMPWAVACSTYIFGASEWSARLVSAVSMALGALVVFVFVHRWFGKPYSLIAGLALVLAPSLWWYPPIARSAEIEALLNVFVAAAGLLILQVLLGRLRGSGEPRPWLRTMMLVFVLTLALAGALLTKGPAGVPIFVATACAGLVLRRADGRLTRGGTRDWIAIIIAALIAGSALAAWAWLAKVRVRNAGESVVLESPTLFLFQPQRLFEIVTLPLVVLVASLPTSLGVLAIAAYQRATLTQPGTHQRVRMAQALALTAALSLLIFMLAGIGNNRYVVPVIPIFAAACGAGAWVLVQRSRGFDFTAQLRERRRLRRFAVVMTVLLIGAAALSAWYGEHRRNVRTSGKSFGMTMGEQLTKDGELWADQVIDTRPEVIMAALQVAKSRGVHVRARWMPLSLWRERNEPTSVPVPPVGSYLVLRTDDMPRRDVYELDEEREYLRVMPRLREVHRGMVHNFEYRLYEVVEHD
jgi:4-amino-4-deoxy-L-arabinose transferase-like glycosyltransferase